MKKFWEASLYGFLIALGLSGAWLLRSQFHFTSSSLSSQKTDGRLTTSSSDVRVKTPQDVGWTSAYGQTGVNFGDQIFVGDDSVAKLNLDRFALEIQEQSLLTVTKESTGSSVDITEGRASLTLSQGKSVGISVGKEKLDIAGSDGAKLELTRKSEAGASFVGVSLTEGSSSIAFPGGEKLQGQAGQSFVAKKEAGKGFDIARFDLKSLAPKERSAYLSKQTVNFKWKIEGEGLENLALLIARDRAFKNVIESHPVKDSKSVAMDLAAPREPGEYFWTLSAESNGIQIYGEKRSFSVVELRAINIIDPVFEFKKAGVWNVKAVLEELNLVSQYRIQVSSTPDFTSPFINQASPSNTPTLVLERKQGHVYVRARAEYATIREPAPWSDTVTFNVPEPPGVPSLHLEVGADRKLNLTWEATKNTDSYVLEVADRAEFQTPEAIKTTAPQSQVACLKNRIRYARANAHQNNGVYGDWSDSILLPGCVDSLVIEPAKLTPPYLPRFKKNLLTKLDLTWAGDTLSKDVTVEISQDPSFKSALKIKTKNQQITKELPARGTHYLRAIQNLNAKTYVFGYSKVVKVEEPTFPALEAPALQSPLAKEIFFMRQKAPLPVVLKWQTVKDNLGFDIQVSRTSNFTQLLLEKSVRQNALRLNQSLSDQGDYYWRVRSYHAHAVSAWSEPRSFTVTYAQ